MDGCMWFVCMMASSVGLCSTVDCCCYSLCVLCSFIRFELLCPIHFDFFCITNSVWTEPTNTVAFILRCRAPFALLLFLPIVNVCALFHSYVICLTSPTSVRRTSDDTYVYKNGDVSHMWHIYTFSSRSEIYSGQLKFIIPSRSIVQEYIQPPRT